MDQVRRILTESQTIAVIGAHPDDSKHAHKVPAYMLAQGYTIIPVNPRHAGKTLFGATVLASLEDIEGDVDVVDVFRRAEALPQHQAEILACKPKVVWFQKGIRNDEVAAVFEAAGMEVVQDRCLLADHIALGLTQKRSGATGSAGS